MQAVTIERFGDTPTLTEQPEPQPGRDAVRVAMRAASTNPVDTAIAAGHLAGVGEFCFPLTLGMDGVGTVTAVGEEVTRFHVGDRVFGQFWSQPHQFGTLARTCVVAAEPTTGALAIAPDELTDEVAAALPTAGMTALALVEDADVPEGGTLFVLGATGGVGTLAVQAAARRGVRVIATASSGLDDDIRALGAAEVVHRDDDLEQALRALAPDGIDAAVDLVGDRALNDVLATAVRDGGALLSAAYGLSADQLADRRIRTANVHLQRKPDRLGALVDMVTSGALHPVIGATVALDQAPLALTGAARAGGLRGKTVVRIG